MQTQLNSISQSVQRKGLTLRPRYAAAATAGALKLSRSPAGARTFVVRAEKVRIYTLLLAFPTQIIKLQAPALPSTALVGEEHAGFLQWYCTACL